jgi:hypothetical protein
MTLKLVPFFVVFLLACSAEIFGQTIYLSGYARDSTTFDLLPYTNVYSSKGVPLVAANENGYFSLRINPGDTIVFTRLGYKPVKISPTETMWDLNVLLPETVHLLEQVIVYDKYIIHGHEQIQKSIQENAAVANSRFKNQTIGPGVTNMVPTFGPGIVISGALSKLLGTDRERRKISTNKAEMIRTQVYYEVMNSMQVKQYLMGILNLSEDDYFKDLEKFKVDYPGAVYLQSREEIIRLMVESFAQKK